MNVKRSSVIRFNNRTTRTISISLLAKAFFICSSVFLSNILFSSPTYANEEKTSTSQELPKAQELPKDSRVPGGIAVIPLSNGNISDNQASSEIKVTFNNKPVWQIKNKNQHWAVIGIPLNQKPGPLTYFVNDKARTITVKNKIYREQHLTVKKKHANPPARDMDRIREEMRLSLNAFSLFSDINKDRPYQQFITPAKGPISSPFGLKRFFNEQPRRPHSGLDIAGSRGSNIVAPFPGKVVLTGEFFFNGNSVFIDHGQGLVTMYCHMDKLESKQGQWVEAGDIIGKIGATGRVTGPHLHWTVSLNNTRIDPVLFINPHPEK